MIGPEPFGHSPGDSGNHHALQCNDRTDHAKGNFGVGDLPVIFTIHGDEHTDGTVNGGGGKDYNESERGPEDPITDFPGLSKSGFDRNWIGVGLVVLSLPKR